jgi:hypothetical protein
MTLHRLRLRFVPGVDQGEDGVAQPASKRTTVGIKQSSGASRRNFIGKFFYVNGKSLAIGFTRSRGGNFFVVNDSD